MTTWSGLDGTAFDGERVSQPSASVDLTRLANGLTVVSQPMPHSTTASIGLWFGHGSRDEPAADHGVSHFLEHMLFKGTATRTARQHAEAIEAVGGEINAATGVEHTGYFARVAAADTALAVDLIADMVMAPLMADADIERERAVILQEMAADGDEPEDLAHDLFQALAYPGEAIGRPIIGTRASVAAIGRAALLAQLERVRRGPSMVLAAAGAVDHAVLLARAEAHFAGLSGSPAPERKPPRYKGGRKAHVDDYEQTHLLIGFPAPGRHERHAVAAGVLADVLGGGTTSRLFQNVREEKGLCYSIDAFSSPFADAGLFGVYAATAPERMEAVVAAISEELEGLLSRSVSAAEVGRARAHQRLGLLTMLESSGAMVEHLALDLLEFGRVRSPEELLAWVDAVGAAELSDVATAILGARPTVVEVGSVAAPAPTFARLEALTRGATQ
jgi:predicted Zn-dependent peptidase